MRIKELNVKEIYAHPGNENAQHSRRMSRKETSL